MTMDNNFSLYSRIHTLGPEVTNCNLAADNWIKRKKINMQIILHETFEGAVEASKQDTKGMVLISSTYHKIHDVIYDNINWLSPIDSFIVPTHEMVLAHNVDIKSNSRIALHEATLSLLNDSRKIKYKHYFTSSTWEAASLCSLQKTSYCLTTKKASSEFNLKILQSYGKIELVFILFSST